MDRIIVTGGKRLSGEVEVSGAKNAALPILASSLLADGEHTYRNVPHLASVTTMLKVLRTMGCEADRHAARGKAARACTVRVGEKGGAHKVTPEAPYDLVRTMRASVLVLGPLVARYGRAR